MLQEHHVVAWHGTTVGVFDVGGLLFVTCYLYAMDER